MVSAICSFTEQLQDKSILSSTKKDLRTSVSSGSIIHLIIHLILTCIQDPASMSQSDSPSHQKAKNAIVTEHYLGVSYDELDPTQATARHEDSEPLQTDAGNPKGDEEQHESKTRIVEGRLSTLFRTFRNHYLTEATAPN